MLEKGNSRMIHAAVHFTFLPKAQINSYYWQVSWLFGYFDQPSHTDFGTVAMRDQN